jgi:hypothetical protein
MMILDESRMNHDIMVESDHDRVTGGVEIPEDRIVDFRFSIAFVRMPIVVNEKRQFPLESLNQLAGFISRSIVSNEHIECPVSLARQR